MEPIVTRGMSNGRAWTHTYFPNGTSRTETEGFGTTESIPQSNGMYRMQKVQRNQLGSQDRFAANSGGSQSDLQHQADLRKLQQLSRMRSQAHRGQH